MNAHSRAGNLQTTRFLYHNGHTYGRGPPSPTTPALLPSSSLSQRGAGSRFLRATRAPAAATLHRRPRLMSQSHALIVRRVHAAVPQQRRRQALAFVQAEGRLPPKLVAKGVRRSGLVAHPSRSRAVPLIERLGTLGFWKWPQVGLGRHQLEVPIVRNTRLCGHDCQGHAVVVLMRGLLPIAHHVKPH